MRGTAGYLRTLIRLICLFGCTLALGIPALAAAPEAKDLAGCWDLQKAESPIDPSSICFDSASDISVVVMGWGEGFGGEGKYRRIGDRIEFSTDVQWEGWLWDREGQDRFSCTFTLNAADEFTISDCSKGVPDQVFVKVPEDGRVRGFRKHREGSAAEVTEALIGCWQWSLQTITDYDNWATFCFDLNGRLRVTENSSRYTLDGVEMDPTKVRDAHYHIENGRLAIERPGGAGWFFHAAKFDCDVVIKPGVKLRLADCNGVRNERGQDWADFSIDMQWPSRAEDSKP